ncbi:DUF3152 domain-containing protein [Actinocorallia longicatena]|uniref:DUF3152 domain-containing protein n=1 Tax=Actinocorallia longicatena TaxID=111803 RepID=A0ABP6QJN3_9ACTN
MQVSRGSAVAVAGGAAVAAVLGWIAIRPTEPRPVAAGSPAVRAPAVVPEPTRTQRVRTVNGRRQPPVVRAPESASGRYRTVPGGDPAPRGPGRTVRYLVEVERGLPFDPEEFAAAVHATLTDPRGWGERFQRVARGPVEIRVSLSSPALARSRCLPLDVGLSLSCWQHGRAVINADRWGSGAPSYGRDLATYREYVISHEVGHGLGHGHTTCPRRGAPAPVMVQQTKSLYGCRPNPWPHRTARIDR